MEGKSVGKVELPPFFENPVRPDIIRRAVISLQSHMFQPQGRDPMAGKRTTAESLGVGRGIARIPRVKGTHYARADQAAFAPGTVKGRLAFPPVSHKAIRKKINRKELRSAFISALAAASSKEHVKARGHRINDDQEVPIVVSDALEKISKSSEAIVFLKKLGLWNDVERASKRKIRSGKGAVRGRRLKKHVSALIVVGKKQGAEKAFRNIPGIAVVDAASLNVNDLAPGTHPGRLSVWTQSALRALATRLKVI